MAEGERRRGENVLLQLALPFFLAGFGMILAGVLLDRVQFWPVFLALPELMALVPALLGLKGNLEMTLASRLSTMANANRLEDANTARDVAVASLALVQVQAVVVGAAAAAFSVMASDDAVDSSFGASLFVVMTTISVVTASIASFILATVTMMVIVVSRTFGVNPDNVATPIAASLGDLVTLAILSYMATLVWSAQKAYPCLCPSLLTAYAMLLPLLAFVAWRSEATRPVLVLGWGPVLAAAAISSAGGHILRATVSAFPAAAAYQPVINGAAGNLVAVHASRMATDLHTHGMPGEVANNLKGPDLFFHLLRTLLLRPSASFLGADAFTAAHAATARLLLAVSVPAHLVFNAVIAFIQDTGLWSEAHFHLLYVSAALLQVWALLHVCAWLVPSLFAAGMDPDTAAIPMLTALGDILGGIAVVAVFAAKSCIS